MGSEDLRCWPAVPGHSGPCLRACSFDQLSRTTRTRSEGPRVQPAVPGDSIPCPVPTGSTSCPGCSHLGPRARGGYQLSRVAQARVQGPVVDQLPQATWALVGHSVVSSRCPGRLVLVSEGPRVRPAVPGLSGPCPRARGFEHLYRVICARVRSPAGSTSCPGGFGPGPKGPCGRPAVLHDSTRV